MGTTPIWAYDQTRRSLKTFPIGTSMSHPDALREDTPSPTLVHGPSALRYGSTLDMHGQQPTAKGILGDFGEADEHIPVCLCAGDLVMLSPSEEDEDSIADVRAHYFGVKAFGDGIQDLTLGVFDYDYCARGDIGSFHDRCCFEVVCSSVRRGEPLTYGVTVSFKSVSTGLYVSARAHNGARSREVGTTAATLAHCNSRELAAHLLFRIQPQLRVRGEGEAVYVGDRLLVENVQSHQYLHVPAASGAPSSGWSGSSVFGSTTLAEGGGSVLGGGRGGRGFREANLSFRTTGWRVARFAEFTPRRGEVLRAGDVVVLFHRQQQGYLRANVRPDHAWLESMRQIHNRDAQEGDSSNSQAVDLQPCLLRAREAPAGHAGVSLRTISQPKKLKQPWKALWQVEGASPTIGGPIRWGSTQIRLRNMLTGCYLVAPQSTGAEGSGLVPQGSGEVELARPATGEFSFTNEGFWGYEGSVEQSAGVAAGKAPISGARGLFRLIPIAAHREDDVRMRTCAALQGMDSKQWVHAARSVKTDDDEHPKATATPLVRGAADEPYSHSHCGATQGRVVRVTTVFTRREDDAFEIVPAAPGSAALLLMGLDLKRPLAALLVQQRRSNMLHRDTHHDKVRMFPEYSSATKHIPPPRETGDGLHPGPRELTTFTSWPGSGKSRSQEVAIHALRALREFLAGGHVVGAPVALTTSGSAAGTFPSGMRGNAPQGTLPSGARDTLTPEQLRIRQSLCRDIQLIEVLWLLVLRRYGEVKATKALRVQNWGQSAGVETQLDKSTVLGESVRDGKRAANDGRKGATPDIDYNANRRTRIADANVDHGSKIAQQSFAVLALVLEKNDCNQRYFLNSARLTLPGAGGSKGSSMDGNTTGSDSEDGHYDELIQTLIEMIGLGWGSESVLSALFDDNAYLTQRLDEKIIDAIVQPAGTLHSARHLKFLTSICVCFGVPMPTIQAWVVAAVRRHRTFLPLQCAQGGGDLRLENNLTSSRAWRPGSGGEGPVSVTTPEIHLPSAIARIVQSLAHPASAAIPGQHSEQSLDGLPGEEGMWLSLAALYEARTRLQVRASTASPHRPIAPRAGAGASEHRTSHSGRGHTEEVMAENVHGVQEHFSNNAAGASIKQDTGVHDLRALSAICSFHLASLDLLAALCAGGNKVGFALAHEICPFDHTLAVLDSISPVLPADVRAHYVRVFEASFVVAVDPLAHAAAVRNADSLVRLTRLWEGQGGASEPHTWRSFGAETRKGHAAHDLVLQKGRVHSWLLDALRESRDALPTGNCAASSPLERTDERSSVIEVVTRTVPDLLGLASQGSDGAPGASSRCPDEGTRRSSVNGAKLSEHPGLIGSAPPGVSTTARLEFAKAVVSVVRSLAAVHFFDTPQAETTVQSRLLELLAHVTVPLDKVITSAHQGKAVTLNNRLVARSTSDHLTNDVHTDVIRALKLFCSVRLDRQLSSTLHYFRMLYDLVRYAQASTVTRGSNGTEEEGELAEQAAVLDVATTHLVPTQLDVGTVRSGAVQMVLKQVQAILADSTHWREELGSHLLAAIAAESSALVDEALDTLCELHSSRRYLCEAVAGVTLLIDPSDVNVHKAAADCFRVLRLAASGGLGNASGTGASGVVKALTTCHKLLTEAFASSPERARAAQRIFAHFRAPGLIGEMLDRLVLVNQDAEQNDAPARPETGGKSAVSSEIESVVDTAYHFLCTLCYDDMDMQAAVLKGCSMRVHVERHCSRAALRCLAQCYDDNMDAATRDAPAVVPWAISNMRKWAKQHADPQAEAWEWCADYAVLLSEMVTHRGKPALANQILVFREVRDAQVDLITDAAGGRGLLPHAGLGGDMATAGHSKSRLSEEGRAVSVGGAQSYTWTQATRILPDRPQLRAHVALLELYSACSTGHNLGAIHDGLCAILPTETLVEAASETLRCTHNLETFTQAWPHADAAQAFFALLTSRLHLTEETLPEDVLHSLVRLIEQCAHVLNGGNSADASANSEHSELTSLLNNFILPFLSRAIRVVGDSEWSEDVQDVVADALVSRAHNIADTCSGRDSAAIRAAASSGLDAMESCALVLQEQGTINGTKFTVDEVSSAKRRWQVQLEHNKTDFSEQSHDDPLASIQPTTGGSTEENAVVAALKRFAKGLDRLTFDGIDNKHPVRGHSDILEGGGARSTPAGSDLLLHTEVAGAPNYDHEFSKMVLLFRRELDRIVEPLDVEDRHRSSTPHAIATTNDVNGDSKCLVNIDILGLMHRAQVHAKEICSCFRCGGARVQPHISSGETLVTRADKNDSSPEGDTSPDGDIGSGISRARSKDCFATVSAEQQLPISGDSPSSAEPHIIQDIGGIPGTTIVTNTTDRQAQYGAVRLFERLIQQTAHAADLHADAEEALFGVRVVQLLQALVPVEDWENADSQVRSKADHMKFVDKYQAALASVGASRLVVDLMTLGVHMGAMGELYDSTRSLVEEGTRLGARLLHDGNRKVQATFVKEHKRAVRQGSFARDWTKSIQMFLRHHGSLIARAGVRTAAVQARRDMSLCSLMVHFLQLMCEGVNLPVQSYLQNQLGTGASVEDGASTAPGQAVNSNVGTQAVTSLSNRAATQSVDLIAEVGALAVKTAQSILERTQWSGNLVTAAFVREDATDSSIPQGQSSTPSRMVDWQRCVEQQVLEQLIYDIRLLRQLFSAAAEFCQGPCAEAQESLVRTRVIEPMGGIFELAGSTIATSSEQLDVMGARDILSNTARILERGGVADGRPDPTSVACAARFRRALNEDKGKTVQVLAGELCCRAIPDLERAMLDTVAELMLGQRPGSNVVREVLTQLDEVRLVELLERHYQLHADQSLLPVGGLPDRTEAEMAALEAVLVASAAQDETLRGISPQPSPRPAIEAASAQDAALALFKTSLRPTGEAADSMAKIAASARQIGSKRDGSSQGSSIRAAADAVESIDCELTVMYATAALLLLPHDETGQFASAWRSWLSLKGRADYIKSKILSIEIVRGSHLEIVHFPRPVSTRVWHHADVRSMKQALVYSVKRHNDEERLKSFFHKGEEIINFLQHQNSFYEWVDSTGYFGQVSLWLVENRHRTRNGMLLLSLVMNVVAIVEYRFDHESGRPHMHDPYLEDVGFFWLAVAHLLLAIVAAVPSLITSAIAAGAKALRHRHAEGARVTAIKLPLVSIQIPSNWMINAAVDLFADWRWAWDLIYLGISASAVVTTEYLLLAYVFKALVQNRGQLAAVVVMTLVTVLIFTNIGFRSFNNKYGFENEAPACDTLLECYALHLDYGLRVAPIWAVGEPAFSGAVMGWALLFNVMYYLTVILVVTAIVSGIIIDGFSELRSASASLEDEIRNSCFICGLDRDELELRGSGFRHHIEKEHNMWHYLFFIIHLTEKERTLLNGQEAFALEKVRSKNVQLFPIRRARCLEDTQMEGREHGEKLEAKVEELSRAVQLLARRLDSTMRTGAQRDGALPRPLTAS